MAEDPFSGNTTDEFMKWFKDREAVITSAIGALDSQNLSVEKRKEANSAVLTSIAILVTETREASTNGLLPAYDAKWCSSVLERLRNTFEEIRERHTPAPKFSFKKKPRKIVESGSAAGQASSSNDEYKALAKSVNKAYDAVAAAIIAPTNYIKGQDIRLNPDVNSAPALLNLKSCIVSSLTSKEEQPSSPTFASLNFRAIADSIIIVSLPVNGPAYLSAIRNSKIFLQTRQFRMYQCQNCDVYLKCGSTPVIEESRDIQFSSWPKQEANEWRYDDRDDNESRIKEVQDFNWLSREPSPYWRVLGVEERADGQLFQRIINDVEERTLNEEDVTRLLNEFGIKR